MELHDTMGYVNGWPILNVAFLVVALEGFQAFFRSLITQHKGSLPF